MSIMSSGMFGMPMVGADICGFNMDTTEELCRRWIQVGAFYPFARSHSDSAATNQELFLWDSVSKAASHVLYWRYRMLPFWYTLMYEAHTTGAPYVRPLFFTFPQDEQTWAIDRQFMLGDSVLVSPVLEANTTSVHAYFPRGVWYDLFGVTPTIQAGEGSLWEDLPTPHDAINVHVRGGSIVPLQEFAMTTTEVRTSPFTLLVAFERAPEASDLYPQFPVLCDPEYAFGHLYVDDNVQVNMTLTSGRASYIKFEAKRLGSSYTLKSSVNESAYANTLGLVVDTVKVLGMHSAPQAVHVNGRAGSNVEVKVHSTSPAVEFVGLNHPLGTEMELVWSTSSSVARQHMCRCSLPGL
jgi:alpha-D-xyloside xylohydrolase